MTPKRQRPTRSSSPLAVCATLLLALVSVPAVGRAVEPCDGWDLVATPNVGNSVTRLTAVTALNANDAWAVGLWRNEPAGFGPVAMRWDGSAWSLTGLPGTGHLGTLPATAGVDAAPNGDVWIVGNVTSTYPTYNLPLVLRWREGDWDVAEAVTLRPQTVYPFAARGGLLYDMAALAADDIWAVGQAGGFGDGGATSVPLAVHWNGSSWSEVDVPGVANRHHELSDVVAIAHDDVWAVGDYRNIAGAFHAITYHWDGQAWSHIDSPIEHMGTSGLDDVVATGPNDVWAIGVAEGAVALMHWDGSQWSLAPAPANSGGSLAAVGPMDLWASGWNGFWHWDGTAWTEVPAAVPGASYVIRGGGMEIVGDCDIWSVGFWTLADGITSFTLAERLQPATTSVMGESAPGLALEFRNPFLPGSPIRFETPSEQPVTLALHDLSGRKVGSLFKSSSTRGTRSLTWNGRGDAGAPLPRGVYYLTLDAGDKRTIKKLVLLGAGR